MSKNVNSRSDLVRASCVLLAALLQLAAGALGGSGALGASVGEVARSHPNPLLPGGTAFMIWNAIYVAVLALAVWQALPSQRGESVHRDTGWWIAIAGVLNAVWVLLFASGQVAASQIVIVALLVALAAAWANAAADAPSGRAARWLLWLPLTLYTGWVAVAAVVGALTTWAAVTDDGVGSAAAVLALALTAVALTWAVAKARAVLGFTAAALWALAWIGASADTAAAVAAGVAAALVAGAFLVRLIVSGDPARAALG